ncbi:41512_t:CDS:2, partial [Gigaspora margarita]
MDVEENLEHIAFQISKLVLRDRSKNVLQELCKKEQLSESCINKLEEDQAPEQKNIIKKKDELIENQLEEAVNAEWNEISEVIIQAANKNIPYIKVRKMKSYFKKTMPKLEIYKEISFLYQIIKKFKRSADKEIELELQSEYNSQIFLLNMKYETEIPLLKHNWRLIN